MHDVHSGTACTQSPALYYCSTGFCMVTQLSANQRFGIWLFSQDCPELSGPSAMQSLTGSISGFLDALTQPPDDSSASPAQCTHSSPANTSVQLANTAKPMPKLSNSDSMPKTNGSGMVQNSRHTDGQHFGQATPQAGGQSVPGRTKSSDAVPSTKHSMSSQLAAAAGTTPAQNLAAVKGVPMQPSEPASDRPQGVGRIVVESLGGLQWQLEGSDRDVERHLYTAVFQLKAAIRDSRCAAMVSFPAGEHQHLTLRNTACDAFDVMSKLYKHSFGCN